MINKTKQNVFPLETSDTMVHHHQRNVSDPVADPGGGGPPPYPIKTSQER